MLNCTGKIHRISVLQQLKKCSSVLVGTLEGVISNDKWTFDIYVCTQGRYLDKDNLGQNDAFIQNWSLAETM